ncbi:hypothetical protein HHK36_007464 [Tetracentron sinense]|uniref:Translation elongation factor EF1B beta/delta subunit guanine nucleotide exchange domain-containing protein n=1 Tax=Tetracentron sinense TaxID=13715 RepID=A0A834ZMJ0_TETSI|nr:hypothetical protein HHK36_007464 [Tetracentron sinense]
MGVTFHNLTSESGLKNLDEHLLTRSYITGYQASKDDLTVFGTLPNVPSSEYVNVSRWYNHIDALLRLSGVSGEGCGVTIEGSAAAADEAVATPPIADTKATAAEDDDDDDVDLFGEETEEEKKAAEQRAAAIKASGKKKECEFLVFCCRLADYLLGTGKSSVLLDVKPWDDETDMQKLEETVRSLQMEGLFWGASKLVAVGYGIKKLQIMLSIVDDLVSVDSLIEEHLTVEPANEYIQSCDIVAFNKICKSIFNQYIMNRRIIDWEEELFWINAPFKEKEAVQCVKKVAFNATIYHLWMRRNNRIFKNQFKGTSSLLQMIKNDTRSRFSLLKPKVVDNGRNHDFMANWGNRV